MDDFKRQLYMEARAMLVSGEYTFVCTALKETLSTLIGMDPLPLNYEPPDYETLTYGTLNYEQLDSEILNYEYKVMLGDFKINELLQEIFTEFLCLYDCICWNKNGESSQCEHRDGVWWEAYWLEPRLRILDYILNAPD